MPNLNFAELIFISIEKEKISKIGFPILKAWLRNRALQFHNNIKIFLELQLFEVPFCKSFRQSHYRLCFYWKFGIIEIVNMEQ